MTFYGIDNQTVELKVTNYQYPDNNEGDWDSNWLYLYLKVDSKCGNWQTIDPSLTTWELQELTGWFNSLSENQEPEYKEIQFTEPNLSFELIGKYDYIEKTIRIRFELESRPKSATDDKNYFVDIKADNKELRRISEELQKETEKYPKKKPTA